MICLVFTEEKLNKVAHFILFLVGSRWDNVYFFFKKEGILRLWVKIFGNKRKSNKWDLNTMRENLLTFVMLTLLVHWHAVMHANYACCIIKCFSPFQHTVLSKLFIWEQVVNTCKWASQLIHWLSGLIFSILVALSCWVFVVNGTHWLWYYLPSLTTTVLNTKGKLLFGHFVFSTLL